MAAAQAMVDATNEADLSVEASATYWVRHKPEEMKDGADPCVYFMPIAAGSERASRRDRNYRCTVRVAVRAKRPDPDAMDSLIESIFEIVDRDARFAGLTVARVASQDLFDHDLYRAAEIAAFNIDVELWAPVSP